MGAKARSAGAASRPRMPAALVVLCIWRLAATRVGPKFTFWPQFSTHWPKVLGVLGEEYPMRRVFLVPSFEVPEILMLATSVVLIAAIVYVI
jgi:hypothetical protein